MQGLLGRKICSRRIVFRNSHLTLFQIFVISSLWAETAGPGRGINYDFIQNNLKISKKVICDCFQFCCDVAVSFIMNHCSKIRGPGHIVEVDESVFMKCKYNRSAARPTQWVVGGGLTERLKKDF